MDGIQVFVILTIISYLIGAIPWGVLFGWVKEGVDIRDFESGNIGAANVGRLLGPFWKYVCLFSDALKGFLPVYLLPIYFHLAKSQIAIIGFSAFLGHCISIYLVVADFLTNTKGKRKGGKGVSTTCGIIMALDWRIATIGLVTYLFISWASKKSSLGSLFALTVTVGTTIVFFLNKMITIEYVILIGTIALIVVCLHIPNIIALLHRKERNVNAEGIVVEHAQV